MNYLILYSDERNEIVSEIHDAAAISIARIYANLIAYRLNRKVLNIKVYDYRSKLLDALIENDKDEILDILTPFNEDNNCTLNRIYDLAINDGIYTRYRTNKYNINIKLSLEDFIIYLDGHYNAYGLIILDKLIVHKNNIIIREENINGKKRII
jgi:hypothetical protein